MGSWSYGSEEKGFFDSKELDLPMDTLARGRKLLMGWDMKTPCNFENSALVSDGQTVESMEFMGLGYPDMMRKSFYCNPSSEFWGAEIGSDCSKKVASPTCMITSNSFFGEEESRSRLSSSVMESNSHDSSLIDLKLGRLADCGDAKMGKSFNEKLVLPSVGSSLPAKRARTTSLLSQTPFCQVHGCNMDLSASKDYHKRHKVCDVHSKTAKVIVNGIEQRFCQQCSRFHLLSEFDDGKRSCRKRLAGHNERRRKPQLNTQSDKPLKLFQSYQVSAGTRFVGTSSLPTRLPFVFQDILPSGVPCPDRYEQANWCKHIKLEERPIYSPQLVIPITNGQLLPKTLHLHSVEKHYPSGIHSSATEAHTVFDAASTVQQLSGVSDSSCALSLLSAQTQDLSSHSTGIPTASPMIIHSGHALCTVDQNSNKVIGVSSLENFTTNGFHSSGMNSMEVDQRGPIILSDAGNAVDFGVHADGIFQGSDSLDAKYCVSPEHGSTVDLLQLSSHLQRVERQRNIMHVKQESEDFCWEAV
ncbi:hypothetical protein L1049_006711 [Liquidambar formosana]|uniref:SBP-type domain-containing protein n=1 Tax=Liquidambar formosana TaxID=63359 RepID=A0AAP0RHF4_LIQFO